MSSNSHGDEIPPDLTACQVIGYHSYGPYGKEEPAGPGVISRRRQCSVPECADVSTETSTDGGDHWVVQE